MQEETDRRRHARLQRDDQLFIQVLAASESPSLVGATILCQTLDVSSSGIKIEVDQEVPVNSEIDLWIDVRACARKFFLNGLIKWCYEQNADMDQFQLGIELLNMPFSDFVKWQELFDGNESLSHFDQKK